MVVEPCVDGNIPYVGDRSIDKTRQDNNTRMGRGREGRPLEASAVAAGVAAGVASGIVAAGGSGVAEDAGTCGP